MCEHRFQLPGKDDYSRCYLQVEWPNQQDVFPHLKFKVGLSYCFNRNCSIVYSPIPLAPPPTDDTATRSGAEGGVCVLRLDPPLMSSQEPRLSPDGGVMVFTSHDQVRLFPYTSIKKQVLLDHFHLLLSASIAENRSIFQ